MPYASQTAYKYKLQANIPERYHMNASENAGGVGSLCLLDGKTPKWYLFREGRTGKGCKCTDPAENYSVDGSLSLALSEKLKSRP